MLETYFQIGPCMKCILVCLSVCLSVCVSRPWVRCLGSSLCTEHGGEGDGAGFSMSLSLYHLTLPRSTASSSLSLGRAGGSDDVTHQTHCHILLLSRSLSLIFSILGCSSTNKPCVSRSQTHALSFGVFLKNGKILLKSIFLLTTFLYLVAA